MMTWSKILVVLLLTASALFFVAETPVQSDGFHMADETLRPNGEPHGT